MTHPTQSDRDDASTGAANLQPGEGVSAAPAKTMTTSLSPADVSQLEKLADASLPPWELPSALRADEGDSVTLLCDNPEGPPNNAIECCGAWTDWVERRFEGETLNAALRAAYDAREALRLHAAPPSSGGKG